jgi:hypothetical protein
MVAPNPVVLARSLLSGENCKMNAMEVNCSPVPVPLLPKHVVHLSRLIAPPAGYATQLGAAYVGESLRLLRLLTPRSVMMTNGLT